jgi:hypothetical protein
MKNRLSAETSPYLRQHENNPVDWYPWSEDAFSVAARLDRPVLLSVGYSACHWCHVMAHESFENAQTAELMNRFFVNIKVDREERPDVDQLYQGVVQLMGRGGGWPLTVFLTPQRKPFFGGTYFPPAPRHGLPSFSQLLEEVAHAWQAERHELETQAAQFEAGLASYVSMGVTEARGTLASGDDLVRAARTVASRVDPVHGGFGRNGPKFPNPMSLAMMLRGFRRSDDAGLLTAVELTLEKMARGGLYDQLGGGFHRYSVDERWRVPHFEKMLYDNAQLIHLYSEAWQIAPRPLWKRIVEETVAWVQREMVAPEGGFFSAQDADSEGEEGKYFVWRASEVRAALGRDEADALTARFAISEAGNFEGGTNILELVGSETESDLERSAKRALFERRRQRVPPGTDAKVLTGWNGLMIRGLAYAGWVFERADWVEMARRAADFVLSTMMRPDGRVWRVFHTGRARIDGVLEDFGDAASGLLALYQVTSDGRYLEAADRIAKAAIERFWDANRRAFLTAEKQNTDLFLAPYSVHDNAFPSGASTLCEALVGLGALTGQARSLEVAEHYLTQLHQELTQQPMAVSHAWLALDALADGAAEVTVVGAESAVKPFRELLRKKYWPTLFVHWHQTGDRIPEVAREVLANRPARGEVAAYLCRAFACQAPVSTPQALEMAWTGRREPS